jgi:ferric-dicitrate binding protein FerR (iron transport regulator)
MKANHYNEEQSWELLARHLYDESELSEEQIQAVRDAVFLSKSESDQFDKIARQLDLYFEQKQYSADEALTRLRARNQEELSSGKPKARLAILKPLYKVAAAILVGVVLLLAGYEVVYRGNKDANLLVKATDSDLYTLELSDGTVVNLNSHTKISYPETFKGTTREVSVEGEAFFDVKPDKTKPFVIHAGAAQIKVLGTSFNVNAYPDARQVEVVVQTGKVQVTNKPEMVSSGGVLILNPGDKGVYDRLSNSLQKTINQDINFNAWKTRVLVFKATPLSEVIRVLEKVYNVKIGLDTPELDKRVLTTQFNNNSLEFILKVIEETFQLEVSEVDGQYLLKSRS